MSDFQLGLYTFAEVGTDPRTGQMMTAQQRLKNVVEEAVLAEQVGLDVYAVGEHHRPDYAISAPAVVLAAIAARTSRILLSSAVSVLSSDDPVRVFQEFATVDLLSGGRAEIMAGRGSFTESFPLFGYDLNDYDTLFSEKLELLLKIRNAERVTWAGGHRAAIANRGVYPRPVQQSLPVWIAVGGTPQSVVRAATLGLPLAIAIIGGHWEQFAAFVSLYRHHAQRAGRDSASLPISINSHAFVADTSKQAADTFFPPYADVMGRIGRERGWGPMSRAQFDVARGPAGALFVGSVEEVTDKILAQHEVFGHQRFMAQMTVGPMAHADVLRSIELFGTKVAPAVRKALDGR